jgi:hypothetical protein
MSHCFRGTTLIFLLCLSTGALAHGDISCDVPKAERRPSVELQKVLKSQGWTVQIGRAHV